MAKKTFNSTVIIPVWKNKEISTVLRKFNKDLVNEVIVVVDEGTEDYIRNIKESSINNINKLTILENPSRLGIGNAIRMGLEYASRCNFEIAIIMAGNGKDDPREIPRFLEAIENGNDYIQGSRFMKGGISKGLPLGRRFLVKIWPIFWSILTFRKLTEVTNGFRAYKLSLLDCPKVNINQEWLNGYSLEYYLHFKFITNKDIRFTEIPVSKIYNDKKNYSKIKPLKNFKEIATPPILLRLKIKR